MRETRKVKIGEKEFELKTYLTGGEAREIQNVYLEEIKFEMGKEDPKVSNVNASVVNKAQDKAIEMVVVSIDGNTEDILSNVLDLRKEEFDELMKEIDTAQAGLSKKK